MKNLNAGKELLCTVSKKEYICIEFIEVIKKLCKTEVRHFDIMENLKPLEITTHQNWPRRPQGNRKERITIVFLFFYWYKYKAGTNIIKL